ncbi:MAG: hypothetical protein U1A27_09785 [Phycisphaerae bacterium]
MSRVARVAAVILLLSGCGTALAQSELAPLLTKSEFSTADAARVGDWCDQKARAVQVASERNDDAAIDKALAEFEKVAAEKSATPQFRELFGGQCARALGPLTTGGSLRVATRITLFFQSLPVPGTREALVAALSAPQSAVRYAAAAGLERLHPALARPAEFEPVLHALGQAGVAESDPLALKQIYRALDMAGSVKEFAGADAAAEALLTILNARVTGVASGARSLEADLPGFAALADTAPLMKDAALRTRLVQIAARYLLAVANRYVELGPAGGGAALAGPAESIERALEALVRAAQSDTAMPAGGARVSARIRAKADAKAVRESLAGWIGAEGKPGALNAAPWRLPVGLSE